MQQKLNFENERFYKSLGFDISEPMCKLTSENLQLIEYFKQLLISYPASGDSCDMRVLAADSKYPGATYINTRTTHPTYFFELLSKKYYEVSNVIDYMNYCWTCISSFQF